MGSPSRCCPVLVSGIQTRFDQDIALPAGLWQTAKTACGVVESEIKTSEHEANPQDNLLDEEDASAEEQNGSTSWNNHTYINQDDRPVPKHLDPLQYSNRHKHRHASALAPVATKVQS